jgi:hypothetical protein
MDSILLNNDRDSFNGKAYTIDDIISTGNLSLFSKEKKEAILKLKNFKEFVEKIKNEVDEERFLTNRDFEKSIDMFSYNKRKSDIFKGKTKNDEHEENTKNKWIYNLESEQYQLFNNKIMKENNVYSFRIWANDRLRKETESLLAVLSED